MSEKIKKPTYNIPDEFVPDQSIDDFASSVNSHIKAEEVRVAKKENLKSKQFYILNQVQDD